MPNILSIPVNQLKPYHISYLLKTFGNRERTQSRLKELQSSIIFFSTFTESEEIGVQWRKEHAKGVNISLIICALKHLSKVLNIPMHRVCKTSYPVNVYISHYYNQLKPYLDTIQFIEVPKNMEFPVVSDPFNNIEDYLKKNGISSNTIQVAALVLASSLKANDDLRIEHVAFYKNENGDPVFIALKKENGKFFSVVKEAVEKSQESSVESSESEQTLDGLLTTTPVVSKSPIRLPSISTLLSSSGISTESLNLIIPPFRKDFLRPIFVY